MRIFILLSTALLACTSGVALTAGAEPPKKDGPNKYGKPEVDPQVQKDYREKAKASTCKDGIPWLEGNWQFVGDSKVPGFKDTISIRGATFTEKIEGGVGKDREEATLHGRIDCLFKNRILITIEKAVPEGAFGNRSGDDYPCDLLGAIDQTDRDRFLLVCFTEWDLRTVKGLDFEFNRIKNPASK